MAANGGGHRVKWCVPMGAKNQATYDSTGVGPRPRNGRAALVKGAWLGDPCLTPTGR